jgi:outer membrane receptor protein involved in Fe transport
MKETIILLLLSASLFANGFDDKSCIVTGNIIDQNNQALMYTTVVLNDLSSNNLNGSITDQNGYFCFSSIKPGQYVLQISYMGFSDYQSEPIQIKAGERLKFENIQLTPEDKQLSEVIITGQANVSEIKPTYIKYKTESLISQSGGSAGDILKNMPSVAMGGSPGHNRDIRFRGLGNAYTKVLINGRESGFEGNNRETVLDQIPASSIAYIEILSVPGAEYQSEGINGIVNIVLKEDKNFGTKGSAEVMTGNSDGLSGGISLSHKTEKLNLFGRYDFQQRNLPKNKERVKTSFNKGVVTEIEESNEIEERWFNNQSFRTGFDYNFLPKTRFSAEYIYGTQIEDKTKTNDITKYTADNRFKSATQEVRTEYKPNDYHQVITDFNHVFNNNQRLNAGFGYLKSNQDKQEETTVYNVNSEGQWLNFQPKMENKFEDVAKNEYNWNVSLTEIKLWEQNIKMGYSGKSESSSFVLINSKFNYKDTSWTSSESGKDNFSVNEVTHALFLTDEYRFSFMRLTAGARYEFTQLNTESGSASANSSGNYGIFLPNLALTFNIDKTQYITLTGGRRIRRPGFKDLNPYEEIISSSQVKKGNPALLPEKAWAFEMGYLKNFEKFNIGANLFYRDINDVIQKTLTENEQGVVTEQPQNTGHAWLAGMEFMTSANVFKFWEINASYSVFESKITSGDYQGDALKDQYKWSAKAINDFKLPFQTNLQFSVNAVGPKISGTKEENTIWFADLGIEKRLVQNGYLMFRVSDLFNTLKKEKTEYTDKSTSFEVESTPGQIFTVGLKYQF